MQSTTEKPLITDRKLQTAEVTEALIVAALFVPAGLPMIVGSVARHVQARENEMQRILAAVLREDEETL